MESNRPQKRHDPHIIVEVTILESCTLQWKDWSSVAQAKVEVLLEVLLQEKGQGGENHTHNRRIEAKPGLLLYTYFLY
jgi:hypothetical protein